MDSYRDHFRFPVHLSGCVASRILDDAIDGRVAAVFRSSFYVETDTGFVCIGSETLEPSPLSLVTRAPAGTDWLASGLRRDTKVSLSRKVIGVGSRFSFLLSDAANWSPDPVPNSWKSSDLERGLDIFREMAVDHLPGEGLGRFLIQGFHPPCSDAVCRTAQTPIFQAQRWLVVALADPDKREQDLKWVHQLIGLGPGLTPSGDDFIGGVLIALHSLGEPGICRQVWLTVRHWAKQAGNPISYVHLRAASQGQGSAGIHRALAAIMKGGPEAIRDAVTNIGRIGHTSGWDAMAGAIITFDAWLQAHDDQPRLIGPV